MADEVEITNVGGENGVASEATLASLTRAIEKLAASSGKDPKKEAAKVQQQHTRTLLEDIKAIEDAIDAEKAKTKAVKKATEAVNRLSKAALGATIGVLGSLAGSVTNLTSALVSGGEELTDFAKHIPLVGGYLSIFTGLIDQNIDSFRRLSQVGATFGDGLNDIRATAARAGIPLGEFTDLVFQNSERMKFFGATTASGATVFANMSKNLRTGLGKQFITLGYTAQELNESLIDYAEFTQTQVGVERRQNRISTAGATEYLETINQLAAVTGKRRDQIKEEMNASMADQRARLAIATMTETEGRTFAANLAAAPKSLQDALIDAADGVLNNPLSQGLSVASETFRRDADKIKNMNAQEYNNFMARVGQELDAAGTAAGAGAQAIMESGTGYGQALAMAAELRDKQKMEDEDYVELLENRNKELERDEGLKGFSDAIRNIRTSLMDTFITSGVLRTIQDAFNNLAEIIGTPEFQQELNDIFKNLIGTIKSFIDNFRNFGLGTALFGGTKQVEGEDRSVKIKGLFENLFGEGGVISNAFASVTPQLTTMFTNILGSAFSAIGDGITSWFSDNWGKILIGALAGIGILIAAPFIGLGTILVAPVLAVFAGIAAYFGAAEIKERIIDAWNSITGVFSGIGEWWNNLSFTDMISNAYETVTGVFSGIGEWWSNLSFTDMISNAYETVTGVFSGIGEWWSNLSFTDMISNAYETVTGFFSFGDTSFSISQLATDAWTNVTNWFGIDGLDFSISALGTVAWEAVKSWFSFGTDTMFSVAQLATDAWATVTSFFSFGETTFSISGLISNAWESITGFFSLDNFEIPSISSLFQGIIDGVKDFFSFDFELPNFREFLPTWLGGSGKSLSDTESTSETTIDPAAIENASSAGDALNQTQTVLSTFAALPDLQNNLDILNRGLDIDGVRQYNRAMEQLVETLEDLNEVLAEDNRNMLGGGTGVAAADVLGQINTASTGSSEGINQLNRLMSQVLTVLQDMAEDSDNIERNTRSMGGNIANGRISAIR